ncbi:exopolysaccharide biosynthesis protein [Sagittula sp. S175]|uniref:exopolysaccharide biosynthesis protein n=1 Tax=Sagittula sp. S175 TaxID=3415129 RepID=UPI003C7C040A
MPAIPAVDRPSPESLTDLLAVLRPGPEDDRISVEDALARVGSRSFPAVILVPAVLVVSPLSGIPTMPSLSGLLVLFITLQVLLGRKHLWLPGFITRRSISASKMTRALDWLARPAAFMDRHSHDRLRFLVRGPTRVFAYIATAVLAAGWPLLEILPFVTSFAAGAVSMIMYGLMVRDGFYTLWGYVQGALLYGAVLMVWVGIV